MNQYAFNPEFFSAGLVFARPEIFLSLAACAILMLDLVLADAQRRWTGTLAVIALGITAVLVAVQPISMKIVALGGLFELDRMAQVLKVVTLLTIKASELAASVDRKAQTASTSTRFGSSSSS